MNKKLSKREGENEAVNHSLTRIAKGAGIVFTGLMLGKVLGYFYTLFVARLGTEQFGLLNIGLSIISLLTVISLLGLENGVLRYIPYYNARNDDSRVKGAIISSLKLSVSLSLLLGSLLFIFSSNIATSFFHNISLSPIFKIFALTLPFTVAGTIFLSSFRGFQYVDYETGLKEVAEKAIRLVATYFLILIGFGVIGATYSYLISSIVVILTAVFIMQKKVFRIFDKKIKTKEYTLELLSFSLPLLLSGIMIYAIIWVDTLLLGYFKTASEVGIYNAAHSTAALIFVFPTALISLFLPIITALYSKKKNAPIKRLYLIVSRWIFFINLPVFLIMTLFSKQIINILFGKDYFGASLALGILSFGYLIYSLSYTSSNILNMAKKTKIVFIISVFFAMSNVLLNIFLIPLYGVNGAAIATSASYILGSFLLIVFNYKITKTYPIEKSFIKAIIAGLLSITVTYYLTKMIFSSVNILILLLMQLVFILFYGGLLLILRGFEKEDEEMLIQILKKLKFLK